MYREANTTRSIIHRIRKREATFCLCHLVRKRELENLVTTGMIEGSRSRGKQREMMLDGLTKWLNEGRVTDALKTTRNRDAWKVMIAYPKKSRHPITVDEKI